MAFWSIWICACWQPKLKIVAPATLEFVMYPANKSHKTLASWGVPPHPPSCFKNLIPLTFGNNLFFDNSSQKLTFGTLNNGSKRSCDIFIR